MSNNGEYSGYFVKSYDWNVGDIVISKTNKFNLTKGKEYEIRNDTWIEDTFVIKDDKGNREDFSDQWFQLKR